MNEEFEKWAEQFVWFGRDGKTEALEIWEAAWQASRKQALAEAAAICDQEGNEWNSDDLIAEKNYAHACRDRILTMQKD